MTPASASSTSCTWLYWIRSTRQVRASAPRPRGALVRARGIHEDGGVGPHGVGEVPGVAQARQRQRVHHHAARHFVLHVADGHRRRVEALQHAPGQQPAGAPQFVKVQPDVEKRPAIGGARRDREDRDARRAGRRDSRPQRRQHRVVAADPQRLRAARHQRLHGLGHRGAAVHVGFEQREAQLATGFARLQRERLGVGLGRIPGDADTRQRGQRAFGHLEALLHGQERAVADHVRRMLQRVGAIEADAGAERIGDQREDMDDAPVAVGVGHRLHRRRARRQHHVELAGGHLTGDGVAGGQVALRVVGGEA